MKNKRSLLVFSLMCGLLTGCTGKKTYSAEKYMKDLFWRGSEDFKILQLSDIHFSQSDVHEEHFKVIDRTINAANPDLIVLNGDSFTFADKHVVKKLFSHINDKHIPWTFTFGNHDDQGYYSDTYIQNLLDSKNKNYSHCYFVNIPDDNVTGRSNFVLNIKDHDSPTKDVLYQVYLMESHNYNFDTREYDFIKKDQIEWYERMVKYSQDNFGADIKSSMYMHIGMPEFITSWDYVKDHPEALIMGDMEEFGGSPSKDEGFFNKIKELGSTQSISVAHDHANDSVVKYEGVYLCYGVHSTDRIYNDEKAVKTGGSLISINKADRHLSFKNIYTSYDSDKVSFVPEAGEAK